MAHADDGDGDIDDTGQTASCSDYKSDAECNKDGACGWKQEKCVDDFGGDPTGKPQGSDFFYTVALIFGMPRQPRSCRLFPVVFDFPRSSARGKEIIYMYVQYIS